MEVPVKQQVLKNLRIAEAANDPQKDPDGWVTGDEPMTPAQASYLKYLCEAARVGFDGTLTKAAASKRIAALQERTGRGHYARYAV
jgi:hypothetical protein